MTNCLKGFGLGLRTEHLQDFVSTPQRVDWLEVPSDDYMVEGGAHLHLLERMRPDYALVIHGVALRLGSTGPMDLDYLHRLKHLSQRLRPAWISGQLCCSGANAPPAHDLSPLPYNRQTLRHLCSQIGRVQNLLGRSLVVDNPGARARLPQDEMTDCGFVRELVQISGCELLLDVNKVHAGSLRHGFDPQGYIDALPAGSVRHIHLARHADHGHSLIDSNVPPEADPVWALYAYALRRIGLVPTLLERKGQLASLPELVRELDRARAVAHAVARARRPQQAAA